jgi:hypothetical protein
MNFFKKIRVVLLASIMLIATVFGVACGKEKPTPTPQGYSVTFMVEGEQYGDVQTVQRGRRITKPADPTFTTEGYVFTGWFTDEAFAEFTSFLKNFPYQELPQRKKNAICLLNPNKNNESLSRQHRYFNVESRNSFCG